MALVVVASLVLSALVNVAPQVDSGFQSAACEIFDPEECSPPAGAEAGFESAVALGDPVPVDAVPVEALPVEAGPDGAVPGDLAEGASQPSGGVAASDGPVGVPWPGATIADLVAAGAAPGSVDLGSFLAAGGSLAGSTFGEVRGFFGWQEGQRVPFQELRDAGLSFTRANGADPRWHRLWPYVDFAGVPLSALADPESGIDVGDRPLSDFVDQGVVLDLRPRALRELGIDGWERVPQRGAPAASAGQASAASAGRGVAAASAERGVAAAPGLDDAASFLAALVANGLISARQYEAYLADPDFLRGLDRVLARQRGITRWDSPGQEFINEILDSSQGRLRGVLAQRVDLRRGPSAAQVLALYALAGTSDRKFQELAINWLFARNPRLELIYDAGTNTFGFYVGEDRQSSPFLDSLIANLELGDIEIKLRQRMPHPDDRPHRSGVEFEDFCRSTGEGRDGCEVVSDDDDDQLFGRYSVRPVFEAVTNEGGDLRDGRMNVVGPILGLERVDQMTFAVPGAARFGFDINDNRTDERDGHDLIVRDILRGIDRGLLAGSDFLAVNAAGRVRGGLGDDALIAVNSDVTANLGGGVNRAVAADGTRLRYVDAYGEDTVVTVGTRGLPGSGAGVDLALTDGGFSYQGTLRTVAGTSGDLTAAFDRPGRREVVISPGVTVDVSGGFTSTDPDGIETITNAGALVGDGGRSSVIDLGPGDDALTTTPGSTLSDLVVRFGDGEDMGDLAGALDGVEVDLGEDNDVLIVRDTVTGDLVVMDPAASWMWAGDDEISENDQLLLVGDGFAEVDPANPAAGLQRLARDGTPLASIGFAGDPDRVELVAVINSDGEVETYQQIAPDIRQRAAWLGVVSDIAKIAGLVTGQVYLAAAGIALDGAHAAVNGADAFDVAVTTGTGIAGAATGLGWIAPTGTALTSALDGDWDTALFSGLTAIGTGAGIGDLVDGVQITTGVLDSIEALDNGDAFGVVGGLTQAAAGANNLTAGTDGATALDPDLFRQISTTTGVVEALTTLDLDNLGDYTDLALSGVTLADAFGAFDPPRPSPRDPDDGTGPRAQVPVPPLGPPLLYASVAVGGDPVPLEVGQTRVFDGDEGTRWRITNFGETTDDDGRTTSAVLRYQMLDAAGNPAPIGGIDRSPTVEDDSDGARVREVERVEASPDGTSYVVEYSWSDPDALGSGTSPFADFFQVNPNFDPFSAEAWTPTPSTGVFTGLGVGASSLVNSSVLRSRDPSLSFTDALRAQAPGQPLNVARDLATFGVTSQQIMTNDIANVLVGGTIGTTVGVTSQELARRVLNPAANELMTQYQVNRFGRYLDTGDPRYLRGLNFTTNPDIRFDAPLSNTTIGGINFAVPAANLAIDAGLGAAEDWAVDAGVTAVEGLSDNYWVDLAGDSVAVCLGVSVPISIGARRPIWPACYYPAGQSAVARVATDPPPGVDLGPVGEALVETCSDTNPVLNAAQQFVCSAGRNPNDGPPPPGAAGGLAVADVGPGGGLQPGFAVAGAAPVEADTLWGQMRTWQQDLLREGVRADTAAAVFNNRQEELQERFGLSPREATEVLGGTYSNAVGEAIVGRAIVGPGIVGPQIVGPCLRGMSCWGNGPAGILYVGPGESAPVTSPGTGAGAAPGPVLSVPEPGMRGEPRPATPPPAPASDSGNWFWNAATGAWDWWQQANAAAQQRFNDTPLTVDVRQRNNWLVPTAYEAEFPDGRTGVYDARTGDRISGQGPANISPTVLMTSPGAGMRIGPYIMPAGGGVGAPVPAF